MMSCCCLRAFSANSAGKLNIFRHDGNTLGMDGAQVGVFEKTNKVSFSSLLKGQDGTSLKAQIGLEILGDLTNQTLERKLADEQVGTLLVTTNLTESDSSRSVAMRLLDSSRGRSRLTRCLGGELLTRGLASGGFTSGCGK